MEQAGVNSIRLIEARNLFITYNEDGTVVQIANDGFETIIDSSYKKSFSITEMRSKNAKINYTYELNYIELNEETLNSIRRSIYGFLALINFNDLTSKLVLTPLVFDNANQNTDISASYSIKLRNFETTDKKMIALNTVPISWILETGYWNDNNFWLDSANWID